MMCRGCELERMWNCVVCVCGKMDECAQIWEFVCACTSIGLGVTLQSGV